MKPPTLTCPKTRPPPGGSKKVLKMKAPPGTHYVCPGASCFLAPFLGPTFWPMFSPGTLSGPEYAAQADPVLAWRQQRCQVSLVSLDALIMLAPYISLLMPCLFVLEPHFDHPCLQHPPQISQSKCLGSPSVPCYHTRYLLEQ